ncbi:MAG TPA: hypothetical protein VFV89_20350 [Nocardioides sp.]|uniref:hypothetical protein n=1 Tax=Nocardioides sp. TaxID=35761 RepID=UPI002E2F668B|nr:hypothetical protein [Nocardioides sp.]HEX5090171.1 hypothetical protein [Nocardioides sp.]
MKAYRILAYTIAVLVVVQAGAIAWGFFGVTNFIDDGGVIDQEFLDCTEDCESIGSADTGFAIHMFFNGLILIPLVSLTLLIVSFFAKVPKGVVLAATIVVLVILQILVLPGLSRSVGSGFGALHGINALVLMGVAIMAGQRASAALASGEPVPSPAAPTV